VAAGIGRSTSAYAGMHPLQDLAKYEWLTQPRTWMKPETKLKLRLGLIVVLAAGAAFDHQLGRGHQRQEGARRTSSSAARSAAGTVARNIGGNVGGTARVEAGDSGAHALTRQGRHGEHGGQGAAGQKPAAAVVPTAASMTAAASEFPKAGSHRDPPTRTHR